MSSLNRGEFQRVLRILRSGTDDDLVDFYLARLFDGVSTISEFLYYPD